MDTGAVATPRESSLLGSLVESAARLPLRVLEFPLGPIALAGIVSFATFSAYPIPEVGWSGPLRDFCRWIAVTFGAAAVLSFSFWRISERRWSHSVLFSSNYVRPALAVAMLWQVTAGIFIMRYLVPWLELAHSLFQDTGAGSSLASGDLASGFAGLVALVIYFCPGALLLAAVAPVVVGIATLPAVLRKSAALPRVLVVGAIVQTAYWGGAALSLDLLQDLLRPVLEQMESAGVAETMRERPELLESLDPEKDRTLLAYMTQPFKTGRPALQQLGWLLAAPWLFVPAVFVRRRTEARNPASADFGSSP